MLGTITKLLIGIGLFFIFIASIQSIFYVLGFIYGIVFNLFYLFTYVGGSCDVAANCTRLLLGSILFTVIMYFYRRLASGGE